MERRTLGSSVLVSVGYDADDQILEITFTNGRVYRYEKVPELVHRRLLHAPSPGEFFNAEIRDHYVSERVRSAGPTPTSRE
jgi:YD repeat-containing protein